MRLPRTLSGQLVREVTLYSILGLAAIMVVLVSRNALRYVDDLIASGATGPEIATIAGCLVATLSTYAIPVAFLFGVLLATSRMAADAEITAMRACGIGMRMLLVPVLALSAAIGAATAILLVEVEPSARRELRIVLRSMAARGSMIEPGRFRRFGERVFFAKRRDAERGFAGVFVSDRSDPERFAVLHVMDITATILELAGIEHPSTFNGHTIEPLQGKSWVGMMNGTTKSPRTNKDWLGWELFGNRAIRQGDWKISWLYQPFGIEDWKLFNLAKDLGEEYDLSDKYPKKKEELIALWDEYVKTNGVIIGNRSPFEQLRKNLPDKVIEADNYPPIRGVETLTYEQLLKLMSGEHNKKGSKK